MPTPTEDDLKALVARRLREMGLDAPGDPQPPTAGRVASRRVQMPARQKRPGPMILRPKTPELRVVNLLHRGHDGFIPFTRRRDGEWSELGCVRGDTLPGLFGEEWIAEELADDSYFSVHGMFAPAYRRSRSTLPQLSPSLRKAKHVKWLTSCHVDLDVYRVGLDAEDGVSVVLRAAREGVIPPPSLFSMSRGCWVFWILRDDHGNGPVNAWPEKRDRWASIQDSLQRMMTTLGSDAATRHAATLSRIPGSKSAKASGKRVAWMPLFGDDGQLITYTIAEMESSVGLPPRPAPVTIEHRPADDDTPKDASRVERGKRGHHARWHRFLDVLDRLRRMRGGWKLHTRSLAIHMVAIGCRARCWNDSSAMTELARHLDGMEQPRGDTITLRDAERVWKKTTRPRRGGYGWQEVADRLGITPDEAAILSEERSPIPAAAGLTILPDVVTCSPAELTRRRRAVLAELVAPFDDAAFPTGSELRDMLAGHGFNPPSEATIQRDLIAIGRPSPRRRTGRPADPQMALQMASADAQ